MVDKIKGMCEKEHISIKKLEEKLGMGNGTISKWEKSCPRVDTLKKVADYFNVSISYFID